MSQVVSVETFTPVIPAKAGIQSLAM